MAESIDNLNNICITQGDPLELTVFTRGVIFAELGDTVKFMIKANINDLDNDAIISKNISITTEKEFEIYVSSTEMKNVSVGKYYWSLRQIKGSDTYTIIPDSRNCSYPIIEIKESLINE